MNFFFAASPTAAFPSRVPLRRHFFAFFRWYFNALPEKISSDATNEFL
jgi:hypothetical protein